MLASGGLHLDAADVGRLDELRARVERAEKQKQLAQKRRALGLSTQYGPPWDKMPPPDLSQNEEMAWIKMQKKLKAKAEGTSSSPMRSPAEIWSPPKHQPEPETAAAPGAEDEFKWMKATRASESPAKIFMTAASSAPAQSMRAAKQAVAEAEYNKRFGFAASATPGVSADGMPDTNAMKEDDY